jgi:uncharacterized protein (TIGR03790 family)
MTHPGPLTIPRALREATLVLAVAWFASASDARAQTPENVAVVINNASPQSKDVGEYYVKARGIPPENVIRIQASTDDTIQAASYLATIQAPIAAALTRANLQDRILYIVLTKDVPLRIAGTGGQDGTVASVDSELTLLYRRMTGRNVATRGRVDNPYFLGTKALTEARLFSHREHDIYLVSRLDAFSVEEAKALVDRAARTGREGQFVLDQRDALVNRLGEDWLGLAAQNLTKAGHSERVVLETSPKPAREVTPVMGYFSWGSTDPQNRVRIVKMDFAPGAIAGSFVSTDARTFKEPPPAWLPTNTNDRATWFGGSPQSLVGDLIREGVTGAAGQVSEPYLQSAVRPDVLFPAYVAGFNLVESFYLSIPHLSWQTVVVGDPLCAPFARRPLARADIDGGLDAELSLPSFFARRRVAQMLAGMAGAPENAARLMVRAENLLRDGDRVGGRRLLEQASELAPTVVSAHVLVAELYTTTGQPELAAERYRKVIALQPGNVTALNNLAYDLAIREKKPAEALPMARKAMSLAPREPVIMDTVGWIEYLMGNTAEAVRLLVPAAKAAPGNADIRLHNAMALAAQGARAAAAAELAEAVKLDPTLEKRPDVQELRSKLPAQP